MPVVSDMVGVAEEKTDKQKCHFDTKEVKMPRGDKTGPNGNGPMTGRRMGYCADNDRPGYTENDQNYGRNFGGGGFRRGGGRGLGRNSDSLENEIDTLKEQINSIKKQLSDSEK